MSQHSKQEYFRIMHARYQRAGVSQKADLLNEVCHVCGYHRKHAIRKLNQPLPDEPRARYHPHRGTTYDAKTIGVLKAVWEVAGYP